MAAGNGEAEHGGGTGVTPLEERVRRLEKDLEELREQVRTHAQAQGRASAETQTVARGETFGEEAVTAGRPTQKGVAFPFAEATRDPMRRSEGSAREGGLLFRLFPGGLLSSRSGMFKAPGRWPRPYSSLGRI